MRVVTSRTCTTKLLMSVRPLFRTVTTTRSRDDASTRAVIRARRATSPAMSPVVVDHTVLSLPPHRARRTRQHRHPLFGTCEHLRVVCSTPYAPPRARVSAKSARETRRVPRRDLSRCWADDPEVVVAEPADEHNGVGAEGE